MQQRRESSEERREQCAALLCAGLPDLFVSGGVDSGAVGRTFERLDGGSRPVGGEIEYWRDLLKTLQPIPRDFLVFCVLRLQTRVLAKLQGAWESRICLFAASAVDSAEVAQKNVR